MRKLLDRFVNKSSAIEPPKPATVTLAVAEREFAAEFERLYQRASLYARKRLGTLWADDVVQEAFVGLWESCYSRGELPLENPKALLYRILRRRIHDHQERETNREQLDDQQAIDLSHRFEPQLAATRVADGSLLAGRINYLLESMPGTTARVFRSVWEHDWDVAAAAQDLKIPYPTVRGHYLRAKHRLALSLGEEGYSVPAFKPRGRDGGRKPQ